MSTRSRRPLRVAFEATVLAALFLLVGAFQATAIPSASSHVYDVAANSVQLHTSGVAPVVSLSVAEGRDA